jgi:hypothetical protein
MPFRGSRTDFTEVMVEDLSQHPFANLPVTLTLTVTDEAGTDRNRQLRHPAPSRATLLRPAGQCRDRAAPRYPVEPGERRPLGGPPAGADRAARGRARRRVYLQLRTAIRRLESGIDGISEDTRDQVAEILWNAALFLEEGDLDDALERLRQAQERLSEAMRQGASDEEIASSCRNCARR